MSFKFLFTNNYSKVILQQGMPQELARVVNGAPVHGLVMPDFEKIANRQHDESYVQDEDLRTTVVPGTGPDLTSMKNQAAEISSNNDVAQELGFDPNKGRADLYSKQLETYLAEIFGRKGLNESGKKGFSPRRYRKALEYFNEQFEKDWKAGEQTRRNEYMAQQREPLLAQKIEQNDAETNSQKKKLAPKLKTAGLNFGSVRDVQTWLTNNGFDTKGIDNMYGANTKAAIDKLLNDTTFGLTDEEKQKFRNFQNSATFYRAKVRKPDPPVVPTQEEVSPYLTGTIAQKPKIMTGQMNTSSFNGMVDFTEFYNQNWNNLINGVNPENTTQNSTETTTQTPSTAIFTTQQLRENNPYFRKSIGLAPSVQIGNNWYPVVVTKDDFVPVKDDLHEVIRDMSYAYDEKTGKILALNEKWDGSPKVEGRGSKWVDINDFIQNPFILFNKDKEGNITRKKQGGKMNNEQELQRAFMAYLIEDAAAQGVQIQSEQDLQAYAQQLGEEGLKAKYQEFMQKMQGGQGVKAALGAKLNYIRKIKGMCPDGQETYFFKEGGSVKSGCKPCMAKAQKGQELKKKGNAIDQFKNRHINSNDTVWVDGDKNKARTLTDDRDRPIVKGMKPYSAAEYQRDMAKGKKGDKSAARRVEKQNEKTMYGCGGKSKKKKN